MNLLPLFLSCSTCRTTMIEGGGAAASWSIFTLLAIILTMLCFVGFFMFRIALREKEHFDPTLSDDYVPSSSGR